jgi:type III restriction enzyme
VTHVLGIRAFGTQLLCEQVIGRALRRQSYDIDPETGLFNVEYADVLGIPFDFTAKPVVAPVQKPRPTVNARAVSPDRDALEIRFPRVAGYRVELPQDRIDASFDEESILELTPALVGPTDTLMEGIVGEGVRLRLEHLDDIRTSTVLFHLTRRLLINHWRDPNGEPKLHLFGELKRVARTWLDTCLVCKDGTKPALLLYDSIADLACQRITRGIVDATRSDERRIKAQLDPYNREGSTSHVNFNSSKETRWRTDFRKCHVNWVICDSDWETQFCRIAEAHPRVLRYVKNQGLGFEVPYRYLSEARQYLPDFIVVVDDGRGVDDPLHLVVEIKGYRQEDAKEKKATMETYWVPGVNELGTYGRWAFVELTDLYDFEKSFNKAIDAVAGASK